MPEAVLTAPPLTPTIPSVAPTTSEPSITISASEFCGLVATLQTLSTTHAAFFQQMTEMRSQQNHSGPDPATSEGHHRCIASVDPQDEPQTVDTVTATPEDASSPPEAPTT
ncbi:hypothetical protein CK203_064666 [Vitis vinifera]|uniref:Uncharacterized protein n=1 Tax=Vitis vinifera TaxID=29760 RepID=A0A438FQ96_VITVI|nr:hypothetical protein CK203_064666 [Vitis vinifera]